MKVAVTAASGALGGAIAKELLKRVSPDSVIAVARTPDKVAIPDVEVRLTCGPTLRPWSGANTNHSSKWWPKDSPEPTSVWDPAPVPAPEQPRPTCSSFSSLRLAST